MEVNVGNQLACCGTWDGYENEQKIGIRKRALTVVLHDIVIFYVKAGAQSACKKTEQRTDICEFGLWHIA